MLHFLFQIDDDDVYHRPWIVQLLMLGGIRQTDGKSKDCGKESSRQQTSHLLGWISDGDEEEEEADLTEPSGPLQREQEALPGAAWRVVVWLWAQLAIFVVLLGAWVQRGDVRQLQQKQRRRTQQHQQGQYWAHPRDCSDMRSKNTQNPFIKSTLRLK